MKLTADRFFVDSNIFLYLLSNVDSKKEIAISILNSSPVISTQVVSENINVAFKKFSVLSAEQILAPLAEKAADFIRKRPTLAPVNV